MPAWIAGKVLWFDRVVGEGLVIDEKGNTYFLHEAAFNSTTTKKHSKKTASAPTDNSRVKFTVYSNGFTSQVDRIKEV